jgi:nanoRNase/pAp phosphatase (c-di-AMP/oligoRNAs hydrolase)
MEVMSTILKYERQNHGCKAANAMREVVVNIVKELESPNNKNILLVGHCKPDGDTIGCVLGLKNALDLKCPDKNVVCAVDDKIPGLFRHKIPGISDVMKRPAPQELFDHLHEQLAQLEAKEQTPAVQNQIDILNSEIETLKDPKNVLDPEQKFDLVVMMDVPMPKRFTHRFKDQIEGADKVIYIDHHPYRIQEWEAAKNSTGVDMKKVHSDKLGWIAELVPAATQQVAIIGSMLLPELSSIGAAKLTQSQKEKLDAFVASTVTGMATDTGAFTRTANLLPQHIEVPVQERPNFKPEGLAKWLMNLTPDSINKKWLREEITYDISDTSSNFHKN